MSRKQNDAKCKRRHCSRLKLLDLVVCQLQLLWCLAAMNQASKHRSLEACWSLRSVPVPPSHLLAMSLRDPARSHSWVRCWGVPWCWSPFFSSQRSPLLFFPCFFHVFLSCFSCFFMFFIIFSQFPVLSLPFQSFPNPFPSFPFRSPQLGSLFSQRFWSAVLC